MTEKSNKKIKITFLILCILMVLSIVSFVISFSILPSKVEYSNLKVSEYNQKMENIKQGETSVLKLDDATKALLEVNATLKGVLITEIIMILSIIVFILSILVSFTILVYIVVQKVIIAIYKNIKGNNIKLKWVTKVNPWIWTALIITIMIVVAAIIITNMIVKGNINAAQTTASATIEASKSPWERILSKFLG